MNCYNKIYNPSTGRNVSIYGKQGRKILKKYIQFGGSGSIGDPPSARSSQVLDMPQSHQCKSPKLEVLPHCAGECSGNTGSQNSLLIHPHDALLPFNKQNLPMQLAWWHDLNIKT